MNENNQFEIYSNFKEKKGIYFAFLTALISGFSVFLSSYAIKIVKNPYIFTTLKNAAVALVLCSLIIILRKNSELKKIDKKGWLNLILIGIIGGSIPFLLFFKGLSIGSPVLGAFIHKTLFIWVTLLAIIFLKEKIGKIQAAALVILIYGNFLLGAFNSFQLGKGELMILAATFLWSLEFILAKKTLRTIDPSIVASARMFIGSIVLLCYLFFTKQAQGLFTLNTNQILWILLLSLFLFGYVNLWYRALKSAPASTVSSVLVLGSPITTVLSILFVYGFQYSSSNLLGIMIILIGAGLFIFFRKRTIKLTTSCS